MSAANTTNPGSSGGPPPPPGSTGVPPGGSGCCDACAEIFGNWPWVVLPPWDSGGISFSAHRQHPDGTVTAQATQVLRVALDAEYQWLRETILQLEQNG
jgi:hypothetical protein